MDHTSIITQVSNPKEEEIISFNQEKGEQKSVSRRRANASGASDFSSRMLGALIVEDADFPSFVIRAFENTSSVISFHLKKRHV